MEKQSENRENHICFVPPASVFGIKIKYGGNMGREELV
jgi:hypothetical protein